MAKKQIPRKISIIGGAGFVGTYFCDLLARESLPFEILDLVESQTYPNQSVFCDVRSMQDLEEKITGDVVVNLAAVHRDDITVAAAYYDTNVLGARNVATLCKARGIKKLIFTSTVAVYGLASPRINEQHELKPFNEYGRTKMLAEKEYQTLYASDDNALIIIRPTVIFGPGNRGNVFNLMASIKSNQFIMVGAGNNKKSMAYVENVALFLLSTLQHVDSHYLTNYVDSPDLTMNQFVSAVKSGLGRNPHIIFRLPYPVGLICGYLCDLVSWSLQKKLTISSLRVKKFCAETTFTMKDKNFTPKKNLVQGIERTISDEFILEKNIPKFFSE